MPISSSGSIPVVAVVVVVVAVVVAGAVAGLPPGRGYTNAAAAAAAGHPADFPWSGLGLLSGPVNAVKWTTHINAVASGGPGAKVWSTQGLGWTFDGHTGFGPRDHGRVGLTCTGLCADEVTGIAVLGASASALETIVATSSRDATVRVWRQDGQYLQFSGHTGWVLGVHGNPVEDTVAS
eukprot:gene8972-1610_t